jgi:hypothetical protein
MIVYQSETSNLTVTLDRVTGSVSARYGIGPVFATTVVQADADTRVMVRDSRAWIAENGWFA